LFLRYGTAHALQTTIKGERESCDVPASIRRSPLLVNRADLFGQFGSQKLHEVVRSLAIQVRLACRNSPPVGGEDPGFEQRESDQVAAIQPEVSGTKIGDFLLFPFSIKVAGACAERIKSPGDCSR